MIDLASGLQSYKQWEESNKGMQYMRQEGEKRAALHLKAKTKDLSKYLCFYSWLTSFLHVWIMSGGKMDEELEVVLADDSPYTMYGSPRTKVVYPFRTSSVISSGSAATFKEHKKRKFT